MAELLTIGAFARRAELTPKALRLYDELGLLRPVHVDPSSGYRYYAPEQLEQARLVAWLRLLGMPLARITRVCALPPGAAAAEVAAYWAQVEHDTESRRRLARSLAQALTSVNRGIRELGPDESGTTLTALVGSGSAELTLVHVGDSRAYLLRAGELLRLTTDHSRVRTLVDEGRLTEAEAAAHPQRALLTRALDGRDGSGADTALRRAEAGDRYLLCSDGLSAVVPEAEIHRALVAADTPETAVRELVTLARRAGAPDNVAVAVADAARQPAE